MNQTQTYVFILGRYPGLSVEEILSVSRRNQLSLTVVAQSENYLVIQSEKELVVESLNKSLGGTVKIGRIVSQLPLPFSFSQLETYFTSSALFMEIFTHVSEKLTFGISYYDSKLQKKEQRVPQFISQLLPVIKNHLELQGFKVRFPRHNSASLSSASVEKNKLLTTGAEVLLIQTESALLIGKTLAVQEFEAFSQRDYGRPVRDMESGTMPPKLARMMLNLSEQPPEATLLDPFCGSGTILQEALLLGYSKVIGSDFSKKAIADTKRNLAWLEEKLRLTNDPKVLLSDISTLSQELGVEQVDAVVTEPFMGPNFKERPPLQLLEKNRQELSLLYLSAWKEFAKLLRPQGVVVMILPVFHIQNQYLQIHILDEIASLGFEQIPLSQTKRKSLIIGNRQDFVLREILKWKKLG